jgi:putative phosphoribosyl transferase
MTRPRAIRLAAGRSVLRGDLCVPRGARGLVVFVHGSGTTRRDASNRFVARRLEHAGFATLLLELLQEFETADRHNVFDVQMQAERLVEVRRALAVEPRTRAFEIGYYATGIGTGVALAAAAKAPAGVAAVVSRDGRPDTALDWLARLRAPTLFVAATHDAQPDWVRIAYQAATRKKALVVVPSAGGLYHELRALRAVADHSERWFSRYLAASRAAEREAA